MFDVFLQQEPPFNSQTNNFSGSGYQYNQGNMNGVSLLCCFGVFLCITAQLFEALGHLLDVSWCAASQAGGELPSLSGSGQPNPSHDSRKQHPTVPVAQPGREAALSSRHQTKYHHSTAPSR